MPPRDPKQFTTFPQHCIAEEQRSPDATGEFTRLLTDVTLAIKTIAHEVRRAGLGDVLGALQTRNPSGETQLRIDRYADEVMVAVLQRSGCVALMASEERAEPIRVPGQRDAGSYVVLFDPIDGSSNIDVNGSVGTIFSIYRRATSGSASLADLLRRGSEQVAAGYALYGRSTMLVYTTGNGVHGFTYDPDVGEFILTHPSVHIPAKGAYYSVNESYLTEYSVGTQRYLMELKQRPERSRLNHRHIATLVADAHRTLLKGGIFLSAPRFRHGKTSCHLRLLYEVAPFAFLVEQAGGVATSEGVRVLDLQPTTLHQTAAVAFGSPQDVDDYNRFIT